MRSDGYMTVNKKLAKVAGINESIIYGELVSRYFYFADNNKLTDDGYFFNTIEDLEEATTLTRNQQPKAINRLCELGLIDCKLKGMPGKRHFKINEDIKILLSLIHEAYAENKKAENQQTRKLKISKQESGKSATNNTNINKTKTNKNNLQTNQTNQTNIFSFPFPSPSPTTTTTTDILDILLKFGIKPIAANNLANKLINQFGVEQVQQQLENLKIQSTKDDIKNPGGWLTTALKENFTFTRRDDENDKIDWCQYESSNGSNNLTNKAVERPLHSQKPEKINYAEFVCLTDAEYAKLIAKYGEEMTGELIDIFNDYKKTFRKCYSDDYRIIQSWVVRRYLNAKLSTEEDAPSGTQAVIKR